MQPEQKMSGLRPFYGIRQRDGIAFPGSDSFFRCLRSGTRPVRISVSMAEGPGVTDLQEA